MKTSEAGINLIKQFEGFRAHAYKCPAGVWTIGYGSTHYPDGAVVEPDDVITPEEATELLADTVIQYERAVNNYVTVDLSQNEYDALVSFVYNVGIGDPICRGGKPRGFRGSTLLRLLNNGAPRDQVANEFLKWNKGGGKVLPGLVKRRTAERSLFLGE